MTLEKCTVQTSFGTLILTAENDFLIGCQWHLKKSPAIKNNAPLLKETSQQITAYCNGQLQHFDLPIKANGTPFQQSVWRALTTIPYGDTVSYQAIANIIKNPRAVRAVGLANGKNPICLIIPCHRVIRATGELGGYAGGIEFKKALLSLESHIP